MFLGKSSELHTLKELLTCMGPENFFDRFMSIHEGPTHLVCIKFFNNIASVGLDSGIIKYMTCMIQFSSQGLNFLWTSRKETCPHRQDSAA